MRTCRGEAGPAQHAQHLRTGRTARAPAGEKQGQRRHPHAAMPQHGATKDGFLLRPSTAPPLPLLLHPRHDASATPLTQRCGRLAPILTARSTITPSSRCLLTHGCGASLGSYSPHRSAHAHGIRRGNHTIVWAASRQRKGHEESNAITIAVSSNLNSASYNSMLQSVDANTAIARIKHKAANHHIN